MATIKDIAEMAGVSVSTVSHVVNGTRFVSPEKVDRVELAIKKLEETESLPNFIVKKKQSALNGEMTGPGKGLFAKVTGQKFVLILLSEQNSVFQDQARKKLEELLIERGHVPVSVCYNQDAARLERIRTLLALNNDLAGVIAFPDSFGVLEKAFFAQIRRPVVLIGNEIEGVDADVFLPGTFEAGYKAVEHLVKGGHERIAFLCEARELSAHRYGGYVKALHDYGIEVDEQIIFFGLATEDGVNLAMRKIVEADPAVTALVISDSYPLIPVYTFLNQRNIRIPGDISIVSLNEYDWAALLNPELTCIDRRPALFAERAAETIIGRIERSEVPGGAAEDLRHESIGTFLNIRASTGAIGRGPFGEKAESADLLVLTEEDKARLREKNYTAAISFHYMGKMWMELQERGMREVFDEIGISLVMVSDAHFDPELQSRQLESIGILRPDILISIPTDTSKTAPAFRDIVDKGIRLVLITNVPAGLTPDEYVTCVSVNEHSHGACMGHGLGEYMRKRGLKHAGLFRHGAKDFFATRQRDLAAEIALGEEYPEVNICGYLDFITEEDVYRKTFVFLEQHPETEAVYVSWDGPALNVERALREAGRSDIVIVTGDLDYEVAMSMASGGAVKMLSAQCPYEQGKAIALAAANEMLGRRVPPFIGVEPIAVRKENLLRKWKQVFHDEPPAELTNAIRQGEGRPDAPMDE